MWQRASEELLPKTVAVVSSQSWDVPGGTATVSAVPQGSGFVVWTDPVHVVTNSHVVADDEGDLREDIRIGPFGGDPQYHPIIGVAWEPELDLAVAALAGRIDDNPVSLWEGDPLDVGTPVASSGFPMPGDYDLPEDEPGDRFWQIVQRLSTGHVSHAEFPLIREDGDRFPVPVYELNLHIYGGNSGGPCFDQQGRVIGVMRSSVLDQVGSSTAFSHAIRSGHLIEALDGLGVSYRTAGPGDD